MSTQPQLSSSAQTSSGSSNLPASSETYERKGYINLEMQTHPFPFPRYIIVLPLDPSEGPLNDASGNLSNANPNPNGPPGLKIDGAILTAATEANGQKLEIGDKLILTYSASGRRLLEIKVGE